MAGERRRKFLVLYENQRNRISFFYLILFFLVPLFNKAFNVIRLTQDSVGTPPIFSSARLTRTVVKGPPSTGMLSDRLFLF